MKKSILALCAITTLSLMGGEINATQAQVGVIDKDQNAKHVNEQMKREEHYAKTQEFLKGDDYNLSEHEIDPKDLENVQVDPPMYDFDMNDVYD
jgi:hypothetical protein